MPMIKVAVRLVVLALRVRVRILSAHSTSIPVVLHVQVTNTVILTIQVHVKTALCVLKGKVLQYYVPISLIQYAHLAPVAARIAIQLILTVVKIVPLAQWALEPSLRVP